MEELLRKLDNICQVAENYPDSVMGPCDTVSVHSDEIDDLEDALSDLANYDVTPVIEAVSDVVKRFIADGYEALEVIHEDSTETLVVFSSAWLGEFNKFIEVVPE